MEHAAVAAFARLAMQLISFGAPSELVELAIQAQRDEVGHARLAFGLASELAGTPVGPGALSIDGSLDNVSLVTTAQANDPVNNCDPGRIGLAPGSGDAGSSYPEPAHSSTRSREV